MATYLLLRNNKEEGPLSLQHLIQLGLKPYDLVWVQGKSAAWRYPSEIPELKPYAAAVEEQPFDRFYKKPETTKESVEIDLPRVEIKQLEAIKPIEPAKKENWAEITFPEEVVKSPEFIKEVAETSFHHERAKQPESIKEYEPAKKENWAGIVFPEESISQHQQPEEISHEKYYPKKTVYVTMPVQQMPAPKQEPVFTIHSSPVTNTREEPVAVETKYSQPLDEIKEMYVKKLQDRKQQSAKKKFITNSLKKAAIFIGIISVGVLIGFVIKPKGSEKIASVNSELIKASEVPAEQSEEQQTIPVQEENINSNRNSASNEGKIINRKVKQEPVVEQNPTFENKRQVTDKKIVAPPKQKVTEEKDLPIISEPQQGVEITSNGERIKKNRSAVYTGPKNTESKDADNEQENFVSTKNLKDLVSIKSNDYFVVAFGGIRNLQLTVDNDSKYPLDNVLVEVQYLRPNGLLLKTENVYFKSVAPNGSLTIRVPDTNRGMKVSYKIVKIESKEFKSDMAGL